MKKIMFLLSALLLITLIGCGTNQVSNTEQKEIKLKTAEEVVNALKEKGLPIGNIVVLTTKTDSNGLLGRPNQYIGKVDFADTTIKQSDINEPEGGSIEFFKSNANAKARKDYIDSFGKESPMFIEYSYINGTALLRLNSELTPEQASEYEKVFSQLKI